MKDRTRGLNHAWKFAEVVTCNAQASEMSVPFWESLGFKPLDIAELTHVMTTRNLEMLRNLTLKGKERRNTKVDLPPFLG